MADAVLQPSAPVGRITRYSGNSTQNTNGRILLSTALPLATRHENIDLQADHARCPVKRHEIEYMYTSSSTTRDAPPSSASRRPAPTSAATAQQHAEPRLDYFTLHTRETLSLYIYICIHVTAQAQRNRSTNRNGKVTW